MGHWKSIKHASFWSSKETRECKQAIKILHRGHNRIIPKPKDGYNYPVPEGQRSRIGFQAATCTPRYLTFMFSKLKEKKITRRKRACLEALAGHSYSHALDWGTVLLPRSVFLFNRARSFGRGDRGGWGRKGHPSSSQISCINAGDLAWPTSQPDRAHITSIKATRTNDIYK